MGYIWEFINLVGILVQFAGCRFLHADLGSDARRDPRQLQTNTTTGQAFCLPRLNVSDGDAMKPYINPLGFIHRLTLEGIRFLLTDPGDSRNLKVGTPVTITQPSRDGLSLAKIRGEIISVGYVTATLTITETILDEGWPQNEETIRDRRHRCISPRSTHSSRIPAECSPPNKRKESRRLPANTSTSSTTQRATTTARHAHPAITRRRNHRPGVPFPNNLTNNTHSGTLSAQGEKRNDMTTKRKSTQQGSILTDVIHCDSCGSRMVVNKANYVCLNHDQEAGCSTASVDAERLAHQLISTLVDRVNDPQEPVRHS